VFTTILDPGVAPAVELARAYAQRWEIVSAFDELKVHQREPCTVMRSRSPDLVLKEIWGHLCSRLNPARRHRTNPKLVKRKYIKRQAMHCTSPSRFTPADRNAP
jgi:hypothetical protein